MSASSKTARVLAAIAAFILVATAVFHAVHELQELSKPWGQPLDDEAPVTFFLEYSFFLTAVADRLAHEVR